MLQKVARWTGWSLIGAGVLILLYIVYLMFFTNLKTAQAQQDLLEEWELNYGPVGDTLPGEPGSEEPAGEAVDEPVDPGDAYAVMWFERPGSDERPVHADPLYVVEGTSLEQLRSGPGHYPDSDAPGGAGNFAVAGHRTTYGAPFYHLEDLREGDEIHVVDRQGRKFVYAFVEQRIVGPGDTWVVGDDPLGTGEPMLTLTTCHPRFSAAQRLIVFAQLQEPEA